MASQVLSRVSRLARKSVLALLGWALLLPMQAAIADSDIALSAVSPLIMPMEQGGVGEFVIRVTNYGPDPVATVAVGTAASYFFSEGYPFAMPPQAGCVGVLFGYPFDPNGFIPGHHFTVGPLAVGQSQDCRLSVSRAPDAINDGGYHWRTSGDDDAMPNNDTLAFVMGSLTDVGIRFDPVEFSIGADGHAVGVIRLTSQNFGPTAVREFQVGFCTDVIYPGFSIDGNIAQGCGSAQYGPVCFSSGFGFLRPALAVGESHSCQIRLRSVAPYVQPLSFPLLLQDYSLMRSDFGILADINAENDLAEMVLGPLPARSVDVMPWFGKWALIAMLVIVALQVLRKGRMLLK